MDTSRWLNGLPCRNKVYTIQYNTNLLIRIIYPNLDYDQAITETKLQTLEERRDELCVSLIKKCWNQTINFIASYPRN